MKPFFFCLSYRVYSSKINFFHCKPLETSLIDEPDLFIKTFYYTLKLFNCFFQFHIPLSFAFKHFILPSSSRFAVEMIIFGR